jgi:formylglycine-generating enzyme required for sulfatase activity
MPARQSLRFPLGLRFAVCALPFAMGRLAAAQPDPSGIEFVTIADAGNANWVGDGQNNNRGGVAYEFKIGKFEVTTSQWVEFMNAAFDRPADDRLPFVRSPNQWGAVSATPQSPGGSRWTVPAGREMIPTGGITWRTAALYCNWLHNGRSSERSAFFGGAYDITTFGGAPTFRDQLTRSPGAQYWIPSLDEWMKAAHWDPNRNGDGEGGWWEYSNGSDSPFVYGPPGALVNGVLTTANAGWDIFDFPGSNPFDIPLGAFESITSPWGLFDVAGGTKEWTEDTFQEPFEQYPRARRFEGTGWEFPTSGFDDQVGFRGGSSDPSFRGYEVGLRIASIPVPSVVGPPFLLIFAKLLRRHRFRSSLRR